MSIYTKNGDKGTTNLVHTKNVSKSDDRIQLEGTIDELTSHIGVVKTMISDGDTIRFLEKIQENLVKVTAGENIRSTMIRRNFWRKKLTVWKVCFIVRRIPFFREPVLCLPRLM